MNAVCRRYRVLSDFQRASDFITANYDEKTWNGYLLQPFFEYAHTHPWFNHAMTHRFGVWEKDGVMVGLACYEMDLGECFLCAAPGYEGLRREMLRYAEEELSAKTGGGRSLGVWVTDGQRDLIAMLEGGGYQRAHTEPITIFTYDHGFPEVFLPEGFSVLSLEDENDFGKIHACLWKGFDHGDEPDDDVDCRIHMQSGPHFRRDLTTVVKAPGGDYACFAGMWVDETNGYAYLEPLATVPQYRRMGLATLALTHAMKKTIPLGARYCFGGVPEFYRAIGFKTVGRRELWKKQWPQS